MILTVSWNEVFVFLILVSSLDLKAQYYPQGPTPHIVLIETNGASGQGIFFASDEASVKQVYLITSRSIFSKNLEYSAGIPNTDFVDEPVIVSYYFSEIEKNFLIGKEEYCGEINPLNIKFNFKSILDSTDCVTFFDSSDVIIIKLYDQDIGNIQRYISFSSVCSLIPLIHYRNEIGKSGSTSTQVSKVYLFSEVQKQTKPYLMNIDIRLNSVGKNVIPLAGTDYVSRVLFKVVNDNVLFYGIVNKEQEVFEVDLSRVFEK